jgi:arylsulfatase I/J
MKAIIGYQLFIALIVTICSELEAQETPPARPNIVFVMADDLGWADVAFHDGNAPTPHLDQLAREGLELTEHYVAPVCSPTRAGLLTGRCWSRFAVTTPTNERGLPWDTVTLATALGARGYDTCLIGKWHLGSKSEWGPNRFGFDHSYGSLAGGVTPWSHRYKKGQYSVTWHRNGKFLEESGHVTDLLTNEAVKWIADRGDAPFFLYLPFTAVHLPLNEPRSWLDKVPESITGEVPRHYAACVMHLDDSVGRVLKALEKAGVREDTLFVFTSVPVQRVLPATISRGIPGLNSAPRALRLRMPAQNACSSTGDWKKGALNTMNTHHRRTTKCIRGRLRSSLQPYDG